MIEALNNYDWKQAFGFAGEPDTHAKGYVSIESIPGMRTSCTPFTREDVVSILLLIEGEYDGPEWVGVFRLRDGRFAVLLAGCDYTGWDCRSGGNAIVADDPESILLFGLGKGERRRALDEAKLIEPTVRALIEEIVARDVGV